ncbi:2OG-Fe(II) oxygenase [Kangiella sp. TOML190]|uniref:2OG-Fe(II) oxygenase n=1 Tax=Kangiella sp. TOML190 TaxID=2931351 RepID=UPI00203F69D8|nr:2OG-Fe(II) oxygenase [Kangiella sp. TOML190]
MSSFINIYENALSPEFCQRCIDKFEQSPNKRQGETGHGVDKIKKNSIDITITNFADEWQDEMTHLQNIVLQGLIQYVRQHPFMLAGAISLTYQNQDGEMEPLSYVDVEKMDDASLANFLRAVYRLGSVNLQKYEKGKGGYFHWHSEHYPHPQDPHQDSLHRTLLWMFYLNDVEEGGETEFYFQKIRSKPKQGSLLIAPAGFTHTHRGQKPISDDKYIFTSWVLYQRAQDMYQQAPQG